MFSSYNFVRIFRLVHTEDEPRTHLLRNLLQHRNVTSTNFPCDQLAPKSTVCKQKGKAVPLQAWSGPEGSRKLRFTDFITTAQDGGKVVSLTYRPPLPPGNTPGTHFC